MEISIFLPLMTSQLFSLNHFTTRHPAYLSKMMNFLRNVKFSKSCVTYSLRFHKKKLLKLSWLNIYDVFLKNTFYWWSLADVWKSKSGMDVLLASLKLETAFSVSRSGYMTVNLYKDSTDRRIFRIHRDILQALGSIIGDVKRIGMYRI